jgi:PKD repeat protein
VIDGRHAIVSVLLVSAFIVSTWEEGRAEDPRSNVGALEEKRLPDTGEVGKQLVAKMHAEPVTGTAPLEVQFHAHVSGGTPPVTIGWTFGDGSDASSKGDPLHRYEKAGVYRAQLDVKDSTGDNSSHWVEIKVE